MANVVEFIYKLTDRMSGTISNIAKSTQRAQEQMERTKTRVDSLERSLLKLGAKYVGITQAIQGGKAFINWGLQMEQTRAKFEVMLGSVEKGNKMIANINRMANATPFDNEDLIKSSETLLSFGYDASKVMGTLDMLGNVAMGDRAKLSGLTLAFAQMSSTGRLMGQDLLQMINQGFNPLLEISKKTGRSMADLKKDMEGGKISAQMVEDAFRSATSEGGQFYGMMEKMSQKGLGKLSSFWGELKAKLTEVAERLAPAIGQIADMGIMLVKNFDHIAAVIWKVLFPVRALVVGAISMAKFFNENRLLLAMFTVTLVAYKVAMISAALAAKGLTIQMVLARRAQELLNLALLKNPFTAALVAVTLLVGAIVMLRKRTKEAADGLTEVNRAAGRYAADEKSRLDMIFDKLRRTNPKSKERNELVKQLQEMYPDVLKNMNLEKAGLQELESAYNSISEAIDRKARARAYEDRITQLYGQRSELETTQEFAFVQWLNSQGIDPSAHKKRTNNRVTNFAFQGNTLRATDVWGVYDKVLALDNEINRLRDVAVKNQIGSGSLGNSSTSLMSSSPESSTSISDLTGGGSRPTNITINLRNLIEYLNMYPATVNAGVNEVSDQLIEGLLRVVNSTNRIASQ